MAAKPRPRPSVSGSRPKRGKKLNTKVDAKAKRTSVKARQNAKVAKQNVKAKPPKGTGKAPVQPKVQAQSQAQAQVIAQAQEQMPEGARVRRAGDIRAEQRAKRQRAQYLKYIARIAIVIAVVLLIVFGSIFVYRSDLFHVNNVQVNGSLHLTSQEIASIAAVSDDSTLLRLDSKGIEERLEDNAWVQSASIHRVFPDTIVIDIVEREPGAVAKINDKSNWVISTDGTWLSAATTDDWENAMKIIDVSPSMSAPISGSDCTDGGILNALEILNSISDDLKSRIVSISAESSIKTSLNLEDGVTVAFGDSSDIDVKEAVINSLLDEYAGKISYINVRVPTRPTYRMLEGE